MSKWLFIFFLLFVVGSEARDVYKWTSEGGEIIYSDTYQPGAQWMKVNPDQQGKQPLQDTDATSNSNTESSALTGDYQQLDIAQPTNDETIRSNEGRVDVSLKLSPTLEPGHIIQVYLDGAKLETELTVTQFSLKDLNRGTHSLQIKVIDKENGSPLISSELVTFHLRKASINNP